MAIDEQARHELYLKLEQVLGREEATTLMEHLPPVGWADVATKRDLDQLAAATKHDLDQLAAATKHDLDQLAAATKGDFALLRADLDRLEQRVTASFRAELLAQTRTMIFALVGTVISLGGVTIAAIRLG